MTGSDHQHQSAHQHQINVKKRVERLERHSVTGHPGSPRKGGVHGWGVPGEEFMEPVVEVLDKNDPNYDPDVRGRPFFVSERCSVSYRPAC